MKKIFILLICMMLLVGCSKKEEIEQETSLTISELKIALYKENYHYVYGEESFELTDKFVYNDKEETINSFKYLGLNQYEFVTDNHTFIISYNGSSVYLTVDNGTRHLFKLTEKETIIDPIEPVDPEPVDPEEPEEPTDPVEDETLTLEELIELLYNNGETWSSGYQEGSYCLQFNENLGYAQGYWPEGTTTGFGSLTNYEYGGDSRYKFYYHWDEVKDNELLPDKEAYDATVIITINEGYIEVTNIDNKTAIYYPDSNTKLSQSDLWTFIEGEWISLDSSRRVKFEIDADKYYIFESLDDADYNGGEVKEFIIFGHYEYMAIYDAYYDTEAIEKYADIFYYMSSDLIKIVIETETVEFIRTGN